MRWYVCILVVDYYSANSANHCDAENGICQCTAMNERCTGMKICSKGGACECKRAQKSKYTL